MFTPLAPLVVRAEDVTELQKQIEDRRSKITELQKQIDTLNSALQKKSTEKISLKNQLDILDGRIQKTKLSINETKLQLQATELRLQETELEITKTEQVLDKERARLAELLRALDVSEKKTLIEVFASGSTLSDFFANQQSLGRVQNAITDSLVKIIKSKKELDGLHLRVVEHKKKLEASQAKLLNTHDQLQSQSTAKAQLLLETKQSEAKFQKLVADLKRQYASTENEISSIERQVRQKLQGQKNKLPQGAVALRWPVPSHLVTASFHDPDYPFRNVFEHPGVDIRAGQGTPVRAAGDGIVARAKNAGMGYSYIIIVHNNHVSTLYGHISRINVKEDDVVSVGDVIGYSGGTPGTPGAGPFVTGPHLHFEVRADGIPTNPLEYLP